MRIEVITVVPEAFSSYLGASILGRALGSKLFTVNINNLRDYTEDKHHITDDYPFGGGAGMVMKIEPMAKALDALAPRDSFHRILCCPQGRVFQQSTAQALAKRENLCILCGRYEGFDERVREMMDDEISLGDFVLTGGELAAMVMIDAVARLLPGVLGNEASAPQDSHSNGLLEYPHYTRPRDFHGKRAPEILLSGNHALIEKWRRQEALYRTRERRPDLFEKVPLSEADKKLIQVAEWCRLEGDPAETPPPPAWVKTGEPGTGNGEQSEG